MLLLDIENLYNGYVVGSDIMDSENNLVCSRGDIVNEELVNHLRKSKIMLIPVYGEYEFKKMLSEEPELSDRYISYLIQSFRNLITSSRVDSLRYNMVCGMLEKYVSENRYMIYDMLMLHERHNYTFNHSINVAIYSLLVGIKLGVSDNDLCDLAVGACLHDYGKMLISPDILDKPIKLDAIEYLAIRQHPVYGFKHVSEDNDASQDVLDIILQHHEKEDGSGYPYGINYEKINPLAKIVTVADMFDAVSSARSYHKQRLPYQAVNILREELESGKLNKECFSALCSKLTLYPVGSVVMLSNNDVAVVISDDYDRENPIIKSCYTGQVYDLSKPCGVTIV